MRTLVRVICIGSFLMLSAAWGQNGPRGHWTGTIDAPNGQMALEVDLDKPAQKWIGTISIPVRNQVGIPLENIALADGKWTFHVKGGAEAPTFNGTLSSDAQTLAGDLGNAGGVFPLKLTRTGDPKIEAPKANAPLDAAFIGTWEGALDTGGATLRLIMKLSNGPNGAAGMMLSPDQGNAELTVSSIEQTGMAIVVKVAMVGGEYRGTINKEGTELNGSWTQGPADFTLKLKKAH